MPDVKEKDEATLLQSVLDALPDAVITITEEGLIASYSQAAERMLGYKAHEVVGMNIKMLMPAPFRDEHDGHMDRYKATKRKNIIGVGREFSAQRKDGTVFPIHLSVSEMFVQGRRMFTGIIRDQSRLKEAEGRERQFSQIVESVSNEVHILDPETLSVLHSNLAAQLNLGYALEEVSNLHPWDFVKGLREIK
jgi:two-component system sensor kinase FixL